MSKGARFNARLSLMGAACCSVVMAAAPAGAAAVPTCSRYAAPPPAGSASGSGTKASPYATVQQLVNSLAAGEVGCLAPDATFGQAVSVLNRPGTATKPFIVQSEDPMHPATISASSDPATLAVVYFGTTTSHFQFSGVNVHALPSAGTAAISIAGDSNAFSGGDITNPANGTCVLVGPAPDRRATAARLDGDAIHSCGNPAGGHADGVSIGYADGTAITNSYLYGSPRHGITLFPDAQHSAIDHNVIDRQRNGMGDGEGVQFAGDDKTASSNNVVEANLISDNETTNIGYNWNDGSGTPGSGNVVRGNCVSNSGNSAGEFQTDGTTHQPVGYSQEGNTVGSDPQYISRDAPPAGYALTPSSPCLGLGPLATATTRSALLPAPDPEAKSVFTARLGGDVDTHLQPATFHFEEGPQPGSLTALPGQQLGAFGMPVGVLSPKLTGLRPSTTYSYRIVPDTPMGSSAGQTLTFTTAPPPKIAPPIPTIVYNTRFKKKRVEFSQLALKRVPAGAIVGVQCRPTAHCPFSERFGAGNIPLLRNRPFRSGTTVAILVLPANPVGRYDGRVTALRIGRPDRRHPARAVKRTDSCLINLFREIPCLRAVAQFLSFPRYLQFTRIVAVRVPRGATLDYRCVRGKCPHFPSCRTVSSGFKDIRLLSKAAARKVKPGAVFDVRVLKRNTSGLVNRFTIQKRAGDVVAVQKSFFVPAGVQHSGSCQDA
jgi:hypothetical protein